ncbi:hypothetical protein HJFPF1_03925 [Paramyrothecium foliicola]|nr:hypothetical protein HJFPF1_03925 [Paramyrothecium foliicola]
MELLCSPADPSRPLEQVSLAGVEDWDGGVFRLYATRSGKEHLIPTLLQSRTGCLSGDGSHVTSLHNLPEHTSIKDELKSFVLTWLFFGLWAEFLGFNHVDNGTQPIPVLAFDVGEELARLQRTCRRTDGQVQYLDNTRVRETIGVIQNRLRWDPNLASRAKYPFQCLRLAHEFLMWRRNFIDEVIHQTVTALGETLSRTLMRAMEVASIDADHASDAISIPWQLSLMRSGGDMETILLHEGWCPSEIMRLCNLTFFGVSTLHYLTLLKKANPDLDHTLCTQHVCRVAQMAVESYKPAHVQFDCACDNIDVDISSICRILNDEGSFPVLRFDRPMGMESAMSVTVEPYDPDVPYVALSHVWSDGLGNWDRNTLPKCQIARLSRLIARLEVGTRTEEEACQPYVYRFWIDTLCCPVEKTSKITALDRMAFVYRNAAYVLVLDRSLTPYSAATTDPAELLLRIFAMSPWIRRLWTLQEAALAQSLYIQFSDRAIGITNLLQALRAVAKKDPRFDLLSNSMMFHVRRLRTFDSRHQQEGEFRWEQATLDQLHDTTNHRAVSVPSDEPLCLATLMDLDAGYVAKEQDPERRMARFWQLIAAKDGGITSQILFWSGQCLGVSGWRWAPASLLASSDKDDEGDHHKWLNLKRNWQTPILYSSLGTPTALGLKVMLPGYRLVAQPRKNGLPLGLGLDLGEMTIHLLLFRDKSTRQWYCLSDCFTTLSRDWRKAKLQAYVSRVSSSMRNLSMATNCALLINPRNGTTWMGTSFLVQMEALTEPEADSLGSGSGSGSGLGTESSHIFALKARRQMMTMINPVNEHEQGLLDLLQGLADAVVADCSAEDLQEMREGKGLAGDAVPGHIQTKMRDAMAGALETHGESGLRQLIEDMTDIDDEEHYWKMLAWYFSYDIIAEPLPDDQVWFVE